jgi:hypothetical protein
MVELATKVDLLRMEQELQTTIKNSFETQVLRLTVNFGAMLVVWVAAVVIVVKLI